MIERDVGGEKRREIIDALRRGTVPRRGLDTFAVGLERFDAALDDELTVAERGGAVFKSIRGEYGCGKTFFSRRLAERAKRRGFAVSEIQISETETPLHRLETVYRRLMERLGTAAIPTGAWRSIVDGWFFALEQDVLGGGGVDENDQTMLAARTTELMEKRLAAVSREAPSFAAALRGYRTAKISDDPKTADGLLAWLAGQPNIGVEIKRKAGLKGDVDHFGAWCFLQGLLVILRDSGHPGLLVVLDEVETLQRMRGDVRDKSLNALRQWLDEIDAGRFPGLYLVVTGTPAFFDGPHGVQRLPPLAQRLHVDFKTEARFDNPRAIQVRLPGFDFDRLVQLGARIRDIYADGSSAGIRIRAKVDDAFVKGLARATAGFLGGKAGVAPRIFLKKLVGDVLDRVEQFDDFDPRRDYRAEIVETELNEHERSARGGVSPDDIDLPL